MQSGGSALETKKRIENIFLVNVNGNTNQLNNKMNKNSITF